MFSLKVLCNSFSFYIQSPAPFELSFCVEFEVRIKVHSFSYLVFQGPVMEKNCLFSLVLSWSFCWKWTNHIFLNLFLDSFIYTYMCIMSAPHWFILSWKVCDISCPALFFLKLFRPSKSFYYHVLWNCFYFKFISFSCYSQKGVLISNLGSGPSPVRL